MSKSSVIDRRGSPLCVHPFERHTFAGDNYECSVCRRPRAMHYHDGFIPSHLHSTLSDDPACRYRGPHPDGQRLNWLAAAQERLAEQERILAGRPLPGSRRPQPEPRQAAIHRALPDPIEPVPHLTPAPIPPLTPGPPERLPGDVTP